MRNNSHSQTFIPSLALFSHSLNCAFAIWSILLFALFSSSSIHSHFDTAPWQLLRLLWMDYDIFSAFSFFFFFLLFLPFSDAIEKWEWGIEGGRPYRTKCISPCDVLFCRVVFSWINLSWEIKVWEEEITRKTKCCKWAEIIYSVDDNYHMLNCWATRKKWGWKQKEMCSETRFQKCAGCRRSGNLCKFVNGRSKRCWMNEWRLRFTLFGGIEWCRQSRINAQEGSRSYAY